MKKIAFLVTAFVAVASFATYHVNKAAEPDPFLPMAVTYPAA